MRSQGIDPKKAKKKKEVCRWIFVFDKRGLKSLNSNKVTKLVVGITANSVETLSLVIACITHSS